MGKDPNSGARQTWVHMHAPADWVGARLCSCIEEPSREGVRRLSGPSVGVSSISQACRALRGVRVTCLGSFQDLCLLGRAVELYLYPLQVWIER